ncbi:hypothetical protein STEG23_034363, partial [Scotinomys teguina]
FTVFARMPQLLNSILNVSKVFQKYAEHHGECTSLSKMELKQLLLTEFGDILRRPNDPETVETILEHLDRDRNGFVDFHEYLMLVFQLAQACHHKLDTAMASLEDSDKILILVKPVNKNLILMNNMEGRIRNQATVRQTGRPKILTKKDIVSNMMRQMDKATVSIMAKWISKTRKVSNMVRKVEKDRLLTRVNQTVKTRVHNGIGQTERTIVFILVKQAVKARILTRVRKVDKDRLLTRVR